MLLRSAMIAAESTGEKSSCGSSTASAATGKRRLSPTCTMAHWPAILHLDLHPCGMPLPPRARLLGDPRMDRKRLKRSSLPRASGESSDWGVSSRPGAEASAQPHIGSESKRAAHRRERHLVRASTDSLG